MKIGQINDSTPPIEKTRTTTRGCYQQQSKGYEAIQTYTNTCKEPNKRQLEPKD